MRKSFFKLYLVTFLFILSLASFTFAGDGQCPVAPPPPPPEEGGRMVVTETKPQNMTAIDLTVQGSSLYIRVFMDLLNKAMIR